LVTLEELSITVTIITITGVFLIHYSLPKHMPLVDPLIASATKKVLIQLLCWDIENTIIVAIEAFLYDYLKTKRLEWNDFDVHHLSCQWRQ